MPLEQTGAVESTSLTSGTKIIIQGTEHSGAARDVITDVGHLVSVPALTHLVHHSHGWVALLRMYGRRSARDSTPIFFSFPGPITRNWFILRSLRRGLSKCPCTKTLTHLGGQA